MPCSSQESLGPFLFVGGSVLHGHVAWGDAIGMSELLLRALERFLTHRLRDPAERHVLVPLFTQLLCRTLLHSQAVSSGPAGGAAAPNIGYQLATGA
jgi:hypothetical protein